VWANLLRRPMQGLLGLGCSALAFAIYGVMFGVLGSFRRASIENSIFEQQLLTGAIIVSGIGMALILLLTAGAMAHVVRLRRYEFGVLKALGFPHSRIIALVVAEAAVPCVAGAVFGLLTVPLLFAMLASWLPPLATLPPIAYTPAMLAVALAVSLLVPALSCVLPALRIARLDAAAALTGSVEAPAPVRVVADASRRQEGTAPASSAASGRRFIPTAFDPGLLRQVLVVTRLGFATLHQRLRSAVLIVGGVAGVMFVLLWILSAAQGIRTGILGSGDASRVMLRAASTTWLPYSHLPESVATAAANAPGVARAADGSALAEPVLYGATGFPRRGGGRGAAVYIVGVGPHWREMTPSFQLVSGRLPRAGTHEVIVGHRAPQALAGLDPGTVKRPVRVNGVLTQDVEWQIVGTFSTGDLWDGYVVADIAVLRQYGGDLFATAVLAKLDSPESFEAFRGAVLRQLSSSVTVEREDEFYAAFWGSLPKPALYVAGVLGVLLSLGIIAAMTQITHAALESRRREIATLRVLGFDGRSVAASVMLEAVLFAVLGALLATGLVWLLRDGDVWAGAWSVFEYKVDMQLLLFTTGGAVLTAVIGTLPMTLTTLRRREVEVLQDLREAEEAVAPGSGRERPILKLPPMPVPACPRPA
jgi:putative ABC transport system permease protein